jgi:hypothetical protein
MSTKKPSLAVFWADTRVLLTYNERNELLRGALLESLTPMEVLLRDSKTGRLIAVTSTDESNLFCALCKNDVVRTRLGRTCPKFATCLQHGCHEDFDPKS